jgi:hypothetical protein
MGGGGNPSFPSQSNSEKRCDGLRVQTSYENLLISRNTR